MLKILERVRDPGEYLRGRREEPVEVPSNILLFRRTSAELLRAKALESFQHHRFVLIYNLGGEGTVVVDDQMVRLAEGRVCVVFPFQTHVYTRLKRGGMNWLFVTFELGDESGYESLRGRAMMPGKGAQDLLCRLVEGWVRKRRGLGLVVGLLLEELMQESGEGKGQAGESRSKSLHAKVSRMALKGRGLWTIGEIAAGMGVSAGHLRLLFRREAGLSLGEYLVRLRMNRAAALLSGTEMRVGEVAEACGYESIYSFSRSFRRRMGLSPKVYRTRFRR